MKFSKKSYVIKWLIQKGINLIFIISVMICTYLFLSVFLFCSFSIPTDSMEPTLIKGDNILVFKPLLGPRIFNIFSTLHNEQVKIHRINGIRNVQRNDILVFNFPHPNDWNKIEMHILQYYVKRCIGLPGDSISIKNGFYRINNQDSQFGNIKSQKLIAAYNMEDLPKGIINCYPFDKMFDWTIKNFGPLYIPQKNDSVTMNYKNYILYKKVIEWEQKCLLNYRDSIVFLNNIPINSYQFENNYYFMAGDNCMSSQDSRYWGLLPEQYIVGKAIIIWKSEAPYTNKFRWNRFCQPIH